MDLDPGPKYFLKFSAGSWQLMKRVMEVTQKPLDADVTVREAEYLVANCPTLEQAFVAAGAEMNSPFYLELKRL